MGTTIQIMVKYHYKCCSRDTTEEVETDEEDNKKTNYTTIACIS